MYSRFLYYLLQFRGLIILTMASLLIVTLVLTVLMKDLRWTSKRRMRVIMLFFGMPKRYMVYLAANFIQLMFVLTMIFTMESVQISHLFLLLFLGVIEALSIQQVGESIRSFVGSIMLYGAFLIVDLLKSYIFELKFDWRIAFACFLLCAFLILYSIYFFINSIKCLASRSFVEAERAEKEEIQYRPRNPEEEAGIIDLDLEEDFVKDTGVIDEED